jgi:hypothetical protein
MGLVKKSIAVIGVLFLVSLVLIWTPSKAASIDLSEARMIYDDGAVRVFALPEPEGYAESYGQAEVGPAAAKAKVKIMTCHVTNPPIFFYDTFPWIKIGEQMAHYVLYEVLGVADEINVIFTVAGPQWSKPFVYKTNWMGPVDPGKYYVEWIPGTIGDGTDFYTTEGYYKMTVKAIPKGNKLKGATSATSQFHIEPAAPPPAP